MAYAEAARHQRRPRPLHRGVRRPDWTRPFGWHLRLEALAERAAARRENTIVEGEWIGRGGTANA